MILSVVLFLIVSFLILPIFIQPPNIFAPHTYDELATYDMHMKMVSNVLLFFKYSGIAVGLGVLVSAIFVQRKPAT